VAENLAELHTAGYQIGQTINFLIFPSTSQGYQQVNFDVDGPMTLTCNGPSIGPIGFPINDIIVAMGGVPPYSFSVASGTVTNGLMLTPLPPTALSLTGTIMSPGSSFTIQATDGNGVVSANTCGFSFGVGG
jgi:hypothetical protein